MPLVNSPQVSYTPDGKPRERADAGKILMRVLIALLVLIVVGLAGYLIFDATVARQVAYSGSVRGLVLDGQNQPLPGAIVFVVGEPDMRTVTRGDGRFDLANVPIGKQTLIVFYAKVGREVQVTLEQNGTADTGTLALAVER